MSDPFAPDEYMKMYNKVIELTAVTQSQQAVLQGLIDVVRDLQRYVQTLSQETRILQGQMAAIYDRLNNTVDLH